MRHNLRWSIRFFGGDIHEQHKIENRLKSEATKLSSEYGGAPVVIIVAGYSDANIPRTMTASSIKGTDVRLRDLLGIMQTAIQIESWKHFRNWR